VNPVELLRTSDPWESAYLRFQTPEQEVRKFVRRLRTLGAKNWRRDGRVVELFCGRGNGLRALERLKFSRICGLDRSANLLGRYTGRVELVLCDCRDLPLAGGSQDIAIVHGGLHHLARIPEDIEQTMGEVRRVLRGGGRLVAVEPWQTPFLSFVHRVTKSRVARRLSPKLDALATIIELEGETYERWLDQPRPILAILQANFVTEICRAEWGKLLFVGRKT
jgi:ubiquinone/menaquinone biosynthesis C-methylase UbiE